MVSNRKTHHTYGYIYWTNQQALSKIAVSKTMMKIRQSFQAVNFLVKLVILYEKWTSSQVYQELSPEKELTVLWTSCFFKNTYFPEHLSVAMTITSQKLLAIWLSLTLAIIFAYLAVYLEPSWLSMVEFFCKNS